MIPPRSSGRTEPSAPVANALRVFLFILVGLFVFEWGFACVHRFLLHSPYPYTTPLYDPQNRFADWQYMLMRTLHFSDPGFLIRESYGPRFSYPAPCIYVYLFFLRLFPHSTRAMLVATCLLLIAATAFLSWNLVRLHAGKLCQAAAWLAVVLGNPTLFLLDRGNIEAFLWFPLAAGIAAFIAERPYLAAICFAFPISMKLYPALFLLLFLPRRQYKAFFLAIAATVAITLAAYAGIGPTIGEAMRDMATNGSLLRDAMLVSSAQMRLRFDHSLFAVEKQFVYRIALATHTATAANPPLLYRSLNVYSIVIPLLFVLVYAFRLRRLPLLNQIAALTICFLVLPWLSYEYTLISIYLVWAVFLIFLVQDVAPGRIAFPASRLYLIVSCFALLIAPITAASFEYFAGQVKAILLLVLLVVFSLYPMPSTVFRDLPFLENS